MRVEITRPPDAAEVRFDGDVLRYPRGLASFLKECTGSTSFVLGDVGARLPFEMRIEIVRELMDEGLLRPTPP